MQKLLPVLLCICIALQASSQTTGKPNIILIICDDLNDYVEGFNGQPQIKTPNMRVLAEKGTTFLNAFVQPHYALHPVHHC
jgi:arylsulfatase A-like enzyme